MDLTQLKHYLVVNSVRTLIDEPVGFDGLKTTIKRGDYHGVSAEVSVGTLEFYNTPLHKGADIIRAAYNTDIDTEVGYLVLDEDGEEVYSGVIDLSTYSETSGNATKISVKVGEVGVKTTFNNRTETEIDMNRTTTIDGATLAHIPTWQRLFVPRKTIVYTNDIQAKSAVTWDNTTTNRFHLGDEKSHQWINIPVSGSPRLSEFGEVTLMADIADSVKADEPRVWDAVIGEYYEAMFTKGSGWDEKYGTGAKYDIEYDIEVELTALSDPFTNSPTGGIQELTSRLCLVDGNMNFGDPVNGTYVAATPTQYFSNGNKKRTFHLQGHLTNCSYYKLLLGVSMRNRNFYDDDVAIHHYYNNPCEMRAVVKAGSYITMTLSSQGEQKNVYTDAIFAHEALNKIVECISENQLTCKSDWYSRGDSIVNPHYSSYGAGVFCGGGALKALTNGYKIRGMYSDGTTERNMPVSFKDIIEAFDALDCIGWGFVEEDGRLYIRVERWDWFYKPDIVLSIYDPNEKTLKATTDKFITSLNIGYKKYTTNEDINAIDSIHSERTFTSKIKAVAKDVKKLCNFIADNYSIEETRRKALAADSEEFKYDENIFVFELQAALSSQNVAQYMVATDSVTNVENINYARELYNPRLSPRRMAERWKSRVALFNTTSPLELTSGSVNYKAKFKCKSSGATDYQGRKVFYLDTPSNVAIAENEMIQNGTPKMRAETMKIKYPLTIPQYKALKRNPYGIIKVDGLSYWLQELQFTFKSGEAELTLIPKNE